MPDRKNLLKARLPRGFADRTAADIRATERMLATIRAVYERYGFEPVETPFVEFTDALGKFLPDQDRPNEGVFSFLEDEDVEAGKPGDWLSLRYDLTAPLARYVAENFDRLPKPYRSYRSGWVFRNEKPGPGRFRQFMQFDADTVGSASPAADAEICMMAADTLEELGLGGKYAIKVNSRKVLDGLMEAVGVTQVGQRTAVLRAVDKLDRLGVEGVAALLGPGRKDDSGDFTKGAGLDAKAIDRVLNFTGWGEKGSGSGSIAGSDAVTLANFMGSAGTTAAGVGGVQELNAMSQIYAESGYADRIRIDPSVVRGLEYYTGAVFEAELLFPVTNDQGQEVVFGSVGGGGRYDGLVGRFLDKDVPATGFSIGVSRLQAALKTIGRLDASDASGPVVVLVMDRDRISEMQAMVSRLRDAKIAAELYLGESGMKAQMKYADRRNAPLAIIQGGDEKARGVVQIKDLVRGKQLAANIADHAAYAAERPGQFEVPEADLVEAVRGALAGKANAA